MTYRITLLQPKTFERHSLMTSDQLTRPRGAWVVAGAFADCLPPVFGGRTLSSGGCDVEGMPAGARLAAPDAVETAIVDLFADAAIACIHAHNAAYGCFAARIERQGDAK